MKVDRLQRLLPIRQGHFRLESGHHGHTWMDLELLFILPKGLEPFAKELSGRLRAHEVEAVCGPLVEGAFAAMMVAERLAVPFTYAERDQRHYRVPGAQRRIVRGKRVAIVTDVVNTGAAVVGAYADLVECGATPVAIAALAVLGGRAADIAAAHHLAVESLLTLPNEVYDAVACPLCQANVPLNN